MFLSWETLECLEKLQSLGHTKGRNHCSGFKKSPLLSLIALSEKDFYITV